jgi:hypothetical protein
MNPRSPRVLAVAGAAVALAGTGAAFAATGGSSGSGGSGGDLADRARSFVASPSAKSSRSRAQSSDEYLDSLANRIGVDRSKLEDALRDKALAEVDWARQAGFLSEEQANKIKEDINDNGAGRRHFGFGFGFGKLGGIGFALGGPGFKGGGIGGGAEFAAAAQFLGLTVTQLGNELEEKSLAEIAGEKNKSVDDLKQALRDAAKESLDDAVKDKRFTQQQADALMKRFDEQLDDTVNGRSPAITDLAERLGVDRQKVVDALRAESLAKIDRAVDDGKLSRSQGDKLKERIQNAPGEGLGGPGFGFGGLCGPMIFGKDGPAPEKVRPFRKWRGEEGRFERGEKPALPHDEKESVEPPAPADPSIFS